MLDQMRRFLSQRTSDCVAPAGATVRPGADRLNLAGGTETVLLAEDEPAMLEYLSTVLNQLGYRTIPATDGEEALRIVDRNPRLKIDLLLTDIVMPKVNGRELVYRLRDRVPSHRVLYCSAYPGALASRNGMLPDHLCFLQKPVTPEKLAETVRWILDAARELHDENGAHPAPDQIAACPAD